MRETRERENRQTERECVREQEFEEEFERWRGGEFVLQTGFEVIIERE
jgi:hypothetical protein